MSLANKLQSIYTNLNSALSDANAALVEKGGSEVADFMALGDGIREISCGSGSEGYDLKPLIDRTLTEISNDEITTIGNYAFAGCVSLTSINFPACTIIGSHAFSGCLKLTSVNLPNCTHLNGSTFRQCTALKSIDLPNCVSLASWNFYYCSSLTSVNIPNCIYVGQQTFCNCYILTSVNMPNCGYIGNSAFYGCRSLAQITCSASYIDKSAFYSCRKLSSFTNYYSQVATLFDKSVFGSSPMLSSGYIGSFGSIYVPSSLVASYKAATNWASYAARITSIPE